MGASLLALAKSMYYIQCDPLGGITFLHNTGQRDNTTEQKQ